MIDSVLPGNYHVLLLLWRPRSSSVGSACVLGRLKNCYYFDDKDIDNGGQRLSTVHCSVANLPDAQGGLSLSLSVSGEVGRVGQG